jgi:hypothetical protein
MKRSEYVKLRTEEEIEKGNLNRGHFDTSIISFMVRLEEELGMHKDKEWEKEDET